MDLVLAIFLFFLLVFSTFIVVDLPFITFFIKDFPQNVNLTYTDDYLSYGFIHTNLQFYIIILCSLILNPNLYFTFTVIYLFLGFYGYPIFYYGGGISYLSQTNSYDILLLLTFGFINSLVFWKYKKKNSLFSRLRFAIFTSFLSFILFSVLASVSNFILYNFSIRFISILKAYFVIPLVTTFFGISIISLFAILINSLKFYIQFRYKNFKKFAVDSTKRKMLVRKKAKTKKLQ